METPTLLLPRLGLTLLPPWFCFILWSDKRVENRAPSVAGRIKGWRGIVAFGASKITGRDAMRSAVDLASSVRVEPWFRWNGAQPLNVGASLFRDLGGHILGAAEVIDVRSNGSAPADKWAVPGQSGIIIGRVWELEPTPCTGARGVYAIGACAACGHIGAIENKGAPLVCRRCQATTPREHLGRPRLRVVAEYGPTGVRQPFSLVCQQRP